MIRYNMRAGLATAGPVVAEQYKTRTVSWQMLEVAAKIEMSSPRQER